MRLNAYSEIDPSIAPRVTAAMNDALDALNRGLATVGARAAMAMDSIAVSDLAAAAVQVQSVAQGRDSVIAGSKSLETWSQAAIRAAGAVASVSRRLQDESTAAAVEGDVAGAIRSMQGAVSGEMPTWAWVVGGAVVLIAGALLFMGRGRRLAGYRRRSFRESEPEDQLSGFGCGRYGNRCSP